jgi:hypothetical protein
MAEPIYESLAWIYKMAITLVVIVVTMGIVLFSVKQDVNVRDVQSGVMLQRFLYSPNGLWYAQDGQTYPGVLDATLLADQTSAQAQLDAGFVYPQDYGSLRVSVLPVVAVDSRSVYTVLFVNQKTWQSLYPRIAAGTAGVGAYEVHTYPVVLRQRMSGGHVLDTPALLRVEVVVPEDA